MITFNCPSCKKQYSVKDEYAGRRTTCRSCQTAMRVPAAASVTQMPDWVTALPDWDNPPPQNHVNVERDPGVVRSQTIRCPFCDSEISHVAKKCKHCGETVDVALRAAEEARRAADTKGPMVFMNAGGASSSSSSAANSADDAPRRVRKSPGTAALLELVFGLFFCTFGIGHIYADNVPVGLMVMFGWWFVFFVNLLLCLVIVGFFTLPLCWLGFMIVSPMMAANSCR